MNGSMVVPIAVRGFAALLLCSVGAADVALRAEASSEGRRLIEMTTTGEDSAPVIGLPSGRVATVTFSDADGVPWPVTQVMGPEADWLWVRRASEHAHVVFLENRKEGGSGNLVALLDGLAEPVHLEIDADVAESTTRLEVRLTGERFGTGSRRGSADVAAARNDVRLDEAIRAYLLSHPEVLREALDPARQLVSRVESHRTELLEADGVPALGDLSGAVTVVEFFDYRCGYCKRSVEAVRSALARAGVRLQMREYPILGEGSVRAARAALAAARQGAYEGAHFALMAHEGEFDDAAIAAIAAELGLDGDRLRADMASPEVDALIAVNRELARRLGVTGTPAFLVLGPSGVDVSPGALDTDRLAAMIDAAG